MTFKVQTVYGYYVTLQCHLLFNSGYRIQWTSWRQDESWWTWTLACVRQTAPTLCTFMVLCLERGTLWFAWRWWISLWTSFTWGHLHGEICQRDKGPFQSPYLAKLLTRCVTQFQHHQSKLHPLIFVGGDGTRLSLPPPCDPSGCETIQYPDQPWRSGQNVWFRCLWLLDRLSCENNTSWVQTLHGSKF